MAAMGAEDHVVRSQVGTDADGDRLLTNVGVAGAVDQAALMRAGELLLALADEEHLPVELEELILAQHPRRSRRWGDREFHAVIPHRERVACFPAWNRAARRGPGWRRGR